MSRHEHFTHMLARRAELSPQEELDLQQHLRDCAECHQTAEVYARQAALLRALPLAEPPPTLRAKVLSTIQQPPRQVKNTRLVTQAFGGVSGRPFLLLAPLAAAVLIVGVAFALLNRPHHTNNTAIAPTAPHVRTTAPTATPTPQPSIAPKPSPTPAPSRKKRVHPPSPASAPSAGQGAPVPTPWPGVNAPFLSQALPTPTSRVQPASPRPARRSSARTPVHVTAPRPTPIPIPTSQPTSTPVPASLPPGVHPIALGGTLPPGRILPPSPEPPTVPAAPVRGAPITATPAPASPPPPPSPVAAPASPVTTPTPIP